METCRICFEVLELKSQIETLRCNHIFHKECLEPWALSCNSCPLCRACIDYTRSIIPCQNSDDLTNDILRDILEDTKRDEITRLRTNYEFIRNELYEYPDVLTDLLDRISFIERIQDTVTNTPITVAYCSNCESSIRIANIVYCPSCDNVYYCSEICAINDSMHRCNASVTWSCVECGNGPCSC